MKNEELKKHNPTGYSVSNNDGQYRLDCGSRCYAEHNDIIISIEQVRLIDRFYRFKSFKIENRNFFDKKQV